MPDTLPGDIGDFVGREAELASLLTALDLDCGGAAAVTALRGLGGIGKTTLALHAAHRLKERYADGCLFIALAGQSDAPTAPADAMAKVIRAFHPTAPVADDADALAAQYRQALAGKRVLLVLDNARDTAQVRPLLPPAGCGALVTARTAPTLPGVKPILLGALSRADAVTLLRGTAGRTMTDGEADRLAELCVDLPLALRVAGAFLATYIDVSPAEYIRDLEADRLAALCVEGDLELDVGAVLGHSARRLVADDPGLAAAWQSLTVFPADFGRDGAAAVWDVAEDAARGCLKTLLARALLLFDEDTRRYRMHDLMRGIAGTVFRSSPAADPAPGTVERSRTAEERFAGYALRVLAEADTLFRRGHDGVLAGLALHDREARTIATAAAWAEQHHEASDAAAHIAAHLPDAGANVLSLRLHARNQIRQFTVAYRAAARLGNHALTANHLGNLGNARFALGEARRAIEFHEQALAISREIGDRRGERSHLGNLGNARAALGEARRAIEHYEQALAISREIGDRHGEGASLGNLGLAWAALGETRRAIEHYERALAISREIGDRLGEGSRLGNLGNAWAALGEARRAIEHYERALAISREIGDRRGEGSRLGNLGLAWAALGETRRAIEHHERALAISREIGDRRGEGSHLGNLGNAWAKLGEARRAIEHYERALAISREIGDRRGEGSRLGNLGLAWAALGETRRAIEHHERALAISREIGDRRGEGSRLANLGNAWAGLGDARRAAEHHEQALAIAREIGDRRAEGARLANLGNAWAALGEARRAVAHHEQALAIAREIGNRHGEGAQLGNLALAHDGLGDRAQAIALATAALAIFDALESPQAQTVRGWLAGWRGDG